MEAAVADHSQDISTLHPMLVDQRLIDQMVAWDAAGRPATSGLQIRAYPRDSDYAPSPAEIVILKRWTRLVLSWNKLTSD